MGDSSRKVALRVLEFVNGSTVEHRVLGRDPPEHDPSGGIGDQMALLDLTIGRLKAPSALKPRSDQMTGQMGPTSILMKPAISPMLRTSLPVLDDVRCCADQKERISIARFE